MLKAPLKRNIKESLIGVGVYYSIILAILIVFPLLSKLFRPGVLNVNFNGGYEFCTIIFMLVTGLSSVKDNLKAGSVFGRSRMTVLVSGLLTLVAVSLALGLLDSIFTPLSFIILGTGADESLMTMAYNVEFTGYFSNFGTYLIWRTMLYLGVACFGLLLSSLNYRLNKIGRWIFWVGLAILMLGIIPNLLGAMSPSASAALLKFFYVCFGSSPWAFDLSMLVLCCIAAVLAWLLQRKAPINRA